MNLDLLRLTTLAPEVTCLIHVISIVITEGFTQVTWFYWYSDLIVQTQTHIHEVYTEIDGRAHKNYSLQSTQKLLITEVSYQLIRFLKTSPSLETQKWCEKPCEGAKDTRTQREERYRREFVSKSLLLAKIYIYLLRFTPYYHI